MKSNLLVLLAEKHKREGGKRPSLRSIAHAIQVNEYTVYGFANNTLREYPADAIAKICQYFKCGVGDLLTLVETPENE